MSRADSDPKDPAPLPGRPAVPSPLTAGLTVSAAAAAFLPAPAGASLYYLDFSGAVIEDAIPDDGEDAIFEVDANDDGAADFQIRSRIDRQSGTAAEIRGAGDGTVGVIGTTIGGYHYPARLAANASVGPSALFLSLGADQTGSLAFNSGYPGSQWAGPSPDNAGYLGLRFRFSGNTHYGWARLTVAPPDDPFPRTVTLHDLAWETTPDTWIPAGYVPEPHGPALLALGAAGIAALRRRNAAATGDDPR